MSALALALLPAAAHAEPFTGAESTLLPVEFMEAAGNQVGPVAATNGTVTLVAWESQDPAVSGARTVATRIAADGTVLDPDGLGLSRSAVRFPKPAAVASDGTDFLVLGRGAGLLYTRVSGATGSR